MERKTEEDNEKMEVHGYRTIGTPKLRCSVIKKGHEGERSKDRRRIRPENVQIENSMRRAQIGKRPKK